MPPLPAAAENFLQLLTHGPPATLMSSLRKVRNPLEMRDETREKQLPPDKTSPLHESTSPDPFSNYITMEVGDWLQVAIGSVLLLPIRAISVILSLLLAWLVAKIGLIGLDKDEVETVLKGRTGWRRRLMTAFTFFGHAIFFVSGFRVTVKGRQASRKEAPILVGAPHSSFLEAVIMIMFESSPVSRLESKNALLISTIQQFYQSLYVDRRTAASRQEAKDLITARSLSEDENLPQLFLCPEGTNTNRRVLIRFKVGAFSPGVPVQPVAIRYPGYDRIDAITWTFNQKHSYMFSIWYLLSKPVNRVEIEFMPVYHPSPEERLRPELYSKNVQLAMAKSLNLPSTEITFTKYYNEYCEQHNLLSSGDNKKKDR